MDRAQQSTWTEAHTRFASLQNSLPDQYRRVFSDFLSPRTIIVVPSLSLDQEVLAKVRGVTHYEQRMLCFLLLLRYPKAKVIYLTSEPVPPDIVDYYLNLLSGVPRNHSFRRLTLLSCHDASDRPLTAKLLERPRLLAQIRREIVDTQSAHMTCFNVSALERQLAIELGVPIYGCDPALLPLGTKSGSRTIFRNVGVPMPDGFEDLADAAAIVEALSELRARDPTLERAVVKLNDGFSGEGNAIFDFQDAPEGPERRRWIQERLPTMRFVAPEMGWDRFEAKFEEMEGIVEAFVVGDDKRSPSAQLRIDPLGALETISTHDQVTGGDAGQIFEGCRFPANASYRRDIQRASEKVGAALRDKGVLGRFGVDFISVRQSDAWRHYAVEINLRKGGTTHPFSTLQFLTEGKCDPHTGRYRSRAGNECCYYASDNLEARHFRGLTPNDLIEIAVENRLHFNSAQQAGVVFHLIGALSQFGKLGATCIAGSPEAAERLYRRTVDVMDRECRRASR